MDVAGAGPIVVSNRSWNRSSSSRLGSNAQKLVETPDTLHNFTSQYLNSFAVEPPPYIHMPLFT